MFFPPKIATTEPCKSKLTSVDVFVFDCQWAFDLLFTKLKRKVQHKFLCGPLQMLLIENLYYEWYNEKSSLVKLLKYWAESFSYPAPSNLQKMMFRK